MPLQSPEALNRLLAETAELRLADGLHRIVPTMPAQSLRPSKGCEHIEKSNVSPVVGIDYAQAESRIFREVLEQHQIDAYSYTLDRKIDWSGFPMLTKQDYIKIAGAVRDMRDGIRVLNRDGEASTDAIMEVVTARLALVFAAKNPGFDSFKFAAACKGKKE